MQSGICHPSREKKRKGGRDEKQRAETKKETFRVKVIKKKITEKWLMIQDSDKEKYRSSE